MKWAAAVVALMAAVSGAMAAWFWYKSTLVYVREEAFFRASEDYHATQMETDAIISAFREASDLNKKAARWTAVSVALGGLSAVVSALVP
jgi:hypothetical protein